MGCGEGRTGSGINLARQPLRIVCNKNLCTFPIEKVWLKWD